VEPPPADQRMFFSNIFSVSNRRGVCEHAYRSTLDHLRANAEAVDAKLAKRGMRLRPEVLEDEARTLFDDDDERSVTGEIQGVLDRLGEVLDRIENAA
jgi:hypothetical protein